jgi:hypothetical protein
MTRRHMARLAVVLALLMPTTAFAQQRTFYGSDGRVTGHSITGSNGATTIYGADGRVSGRASTDSQDTTRIYGSDGRRTGTVRTTKQGR